MKINFYFLNIVVYFCVICYYDCELFMQVRMKIYIFL